MKIGLQLSLVVLAALSGCAFAQEGAHVMGGGDVRYFRMKMAPDNKVVKGAPYTAEAVTETVQTLSNGTRITHQNMAQMARDSEGRTRREETLDAVGPWSTSGEAPKIIMLNDPVAGVAYHLDPKTNTAMKMHSVKGEMPPPPGLERHLFLANGNDAPDVHATMDKLKAERTATVAIAGEGLAAVHSDSIALFKMQEPGEAKTESLGKQTIEGVAVTGTRTTRSIPA